MSNILNPKPRFGYTPATDLIYDYVAQKDVAPTANYATADGSWNLLEVKRAILANETIEFARLSVKRPPIAQPRAATPTPAPVSAPPSSSAPPAANPAPGHGVLAMSAEQLQALKLSPLQAAAMGISTAQMNVTGVTALQVANWGLNAARADALKLTLEQRAILGVV